MRWRDPRSAWTRLNAVLMPLVDLVMLLVLFFALAQGAIQNPVVPVALPTAEQGSEVEGEGGETVLSVDAAGQIYLGGERLSVEELAPRLQQGTRVLVRADSVTDYGRVRGALDALRDQGISRIRLAVLPAEETGGGAQ